MARQLFTNNASSTLYGTLPIGGTTLVLASGTGEQFPSPATDEFFLITLYEKDESGNEINIEIAKCTSRVADTLTIKRDSEGIVDSVGGLAYPSAVGKTVFVQLRWTAGSAAEMLQTNANLSDLTDVPTALTNLGLDAVDNTTDLDKPISTATQMALDGKAPSGHTHAGYEPADATILKSAAIGVTVQPYDADLSGWAGIAPSNKQNTLVSGTNIKTVNGASLLGAGNLVTDPGTVTAVAALNIDCSLGSYFTKTINGNSTFTFSNVPSGKSYAFTFELTHTSGTVTWPTTVKWPGDTAPSLTTGKTHLFVFVTDDGGTRWRGVANTNYVN